jgi:hypothetical protein
MSALGQAKSFLRQFLLVGALLVVILACIVLGWVDRHWGPLLGQETAAYSDAVSGTATQLVLLPSTTGASAYLKVQASTEERSDIFHCTTQVITHTCTNLTQSPAVAEVWPVLNPTGAITAQVAYYGVSETGIDLFAMDLTSGSSLPLTIRAGGSGLHASHEITTTHAPVFSPDGQWIVFPAQATKGNAIELFAARTDGQEVVPVTDLAYQVQDYVWIDRETITIAAQRPDGWLQYLVARFDADGFAAQNAVVVDH